jgi:argininosuccinate lyase
MPFREAHGVVGKIVRDSISTGQPMVEIVRAHDQLGEDAARLFEPGEAVNRRRSPGAGGPLAAPKQKEQLDATIAIARGWFS